MHPLLFTFPCWNQSKLENSIEKYIAFILHYGIIIALAIIRAGRAVSEANKPLRGPSVNINRFLVILYRRYLYGV